MLSIARMSGGGTAGDYWSSLAREDYYFAGGEPPGKWLGRGCAALGISGQVTADQIRAVLSGLDPVSAEPRVQGGGTERHAPGWDFCYSAPKSVSVLWSLGDEQVRDAIQHAQASAVAAALCWMEDHCAISRRGKGGTETERPSGLIAAAYEHGCSRAQDPQLHSHVLVANLAPRADGTWGGLETAEMFRAKMASGAIYRAELAMSLQGLGFSVERDRDSFRVMGVSRETEKHFSQRRQQIEAALEDSGYDGGKASEIAALGTRRSKDARPRAELFEQWRQRAADLGYDSAAVYQALPPVIRPPASRSEILQSLTVRASTFTETDIWRAVAVESQGHRGSAGIAEEVRAILRDSEMVRLQASDGSTRYTTREILILERDMVAQALARAGEKHHPVPVETRVGAAECTLSAEQSDALTHILGPGGIACIQGMAGAGKSYLLGAAREAWQRAGYEVRGSALTGKAAAGLKEGSGIASQTLHSLLAQIERGQVTLYARNVVVIDEAGMVGSRQMSRILAHCHQAGAKVVLVGDARQLQPIDAGGAFRALTRELGAAELSDIRRQKDAWARQAVHDFAQGRAAQGLLAYQQRGMVSVSADRNAAIATMIQDWTRVFDPSRPQDVLMLAGTRAEVANMNHQARIRLVLQGLLGPGASIETGEGRHLEFREGDRILCTRNARLLGVSNGTLGTLTRILPSVDGESWRFFIKTDDGRQVNIDTAHYAHLSHGYAVTTHKAQGLTVQNALILGGGDMASRELAYVQMSRHRETARIYVDQVEADQAANLAEMARLMSRERQKETTLDYAIEKATTTPEATRRPEVLPPIPTEAVAVNYSPALDLPEAALDSIGRFK